MDAIGLLPIYLALTEGLEQADKRRILGESLITALAVAVLFLFIGQGVFRLLGITIADFMIAGGTLLFIFAMIDLNDAGPKRRRTPGTRSVGAVPLGVPLLVGPAVLATILLLANQYGYALTVLAIVVNIVVVGLVFEFSQVLIRLLGRAGIRTVSKITSLILAAIGVMMVRHGVATIITNLPR
jgi:multiple antibiotic resistance protein